MDDPHTKARERVHSVLQETAADDGTLPEGSMLMGWITVAEWMGPDGKQWLSRVSGDSRGEAAPMWRAQGYLHNALFDNDGFSYGDDDGDA